MPDDRCELLCLDPAAIDPAAIAAARGKALGQPPRLALAGARVELRSCASAIWRGSPAARGADSSATGRRVLCGAGPARSSEDKVFFYSLSDAGRALLDAHTRIAEASA